MQKPALLLVAPLLYAASARTDDTLLPELRSADPARQQAACEQLQRGEPLPEAVVPAVAALVTSPAEFTRGACIAAIKYAGDGALATLPTLKQALRDDSAYIRMVAVEAVAHVGGGGADPDVLAAVRPLLKDPEPLVRRFALGGLEHLGPAARPALRDVTAALQDPESEVREAAARAMKAIGEVSVTGEGSGSAYALAQALKDPEATVRQKAAETLGSLGEAAREQRPALVQALDDPEVWVRQAALEALPKVDPDAPSLVSDLVKGLAAPAHDVRKIAVVELEKLGPRAAPAVAALIPLLSGNEIYLRVFTADALAAIGPGAKAALPRLKAMRDEPVPDNGEIEAAQLPGSVEKAIAAIER